MTTSYRKSMLESPIDIEPTEFNMKCFFCDVQKEPDTQVFLESENFIARFDDFPISNGHCEIIPKKHTVSFFDLTEKEATEMIELIKRAKKILDQKFTPDAYNIGVNDGEAAGRTVPHFHLHIIPRYKGDVENPRGGVRNIIPRKADYIEAAKALESRRKYFTDE